MIPQVLPAGIRKWALVTVLFSALPATTSAQFCSDAQSNAQRIALVASGGASRGAYQAGVLWSLVQYLHAVRTQNAKSPFGTADWQLSSMAGASAGNINAMIAAVEFAKNSATLAEASLFYTTWTEVGMQQLRANTTGVVDKSEALLTNRFSRPALKRLTETMEDTRAFSAQQCSFMLGITTTRADSAIADSVTDGYVVPIRRVVVPLRFVSGTAGTQRIGARFQIDEVALDSTRIIGPSIVPRTRDPLFVPMDSVLPFVRASAAFPMAFPPETLKFAVRRQSSDGGQRMLVADSGVFVDGGVFDNNPFSLAHAFALLHDKRKRQQTGTDDVTYLYVSPNTTTGTAVKREFMTGDSCSTSAGRPSLFSAGIGWWGRFTVEYMIAAADYESASFARSSDIAPRVMSSQRALPIFGNALLGFGAFLGRPFREHDFYAGVGDGVRLLAERTVCPTTGSARGSCTDEHLNAVLGFLKLDSAGTDIARCLAIRGLASQKGATPPACANSASPRAAAMARINAHLAEASLNSADRYCRSSGFISSMLADAHIGDALSRIARDTALHRYWSGPQAGAARDDEFNELLANPARWMTREVAALLRQQWRIEQTATPSHGFPVKLAEYGFSITTDSLRSGVCLGLSAAPCDATPEDKSRTPLGVAATIVRRFLVPNEIGLSRFEGHSGWFPMRSYGEFGARWKPVSMRYRGSAFGAAIDLAHVKDRVASADNVASPLTMMGGVVFQTREWRATSLEAALLSNATCGAAEVSVGVVFRHARLAVRRDGVWGNGCDQRSSVVFRLANIDGLAYWLGWRLKLGLKARK